MIKGPHECQSKLIVVAGCQYLINNFFGSVISCSDRACLWIIVSITHLTVIILAILSLTLCTYNICTGCVIIKGITINDRNEKQQPSAVAEEQVGDVKTIDLWMPGWLGARLLKHIYILF